MTKATLVSVPASSAPAVTFAPATFGKLMRLVNNNCSSEAYIAASKALGLPDLEKQFQEILKQQKLDGHLTFPQSEKRYAVYQQLTAKAKELLSTEQYQMFYKCL